MLGHLRRRPTQRSSTTPICPAGGDGTGRWLCRSSWQYARVWLRRRFAPSTPSRSPQTSPYLRSSVLSRLLTSLLLTLASALPNTIHGATEKYFPQAIRGDSFNTTRILVWNLGGSAATVTIEFFNQAGEQLESRVSLLEGNGSEEITLGGPTVEQIIDNTLLRVGWVKVTSDQDVLATAFYSLKVGDVSVPPVGVLPVSPNDWWSGVGEKSSTVNTAIALANPGAAEAECALTAHKTDGDLAGSAIIQLGPGEQTAQFLSQLIPDLALPFQGCLNLHCDKGEVAPVTLTQRDSDGSVAAVAMDSSLGSTELYFPQALRGDAQHTTRILIWNPGAGSVDASVRFYTQLGEQEEIRTVTLAEKATVEIILGGSDVPLAGGWVEITANGLVLSTAFYSVEVDGVTLPPVAVLPARSSPGWSGAGYVSSLMNTGLAVANTGPDAADCELQTYTGTDGRTVGSTSIQLQPRLQTARFLPQMIPGLPIPYQGSFSLSCQRGSVVPVTLTQRTIDNAIVAVAMAPIPQGGSGN